MDYRRLAAIGGIGFVVLQIVANAIPGASPPMITDSVQKVSKFFEDKHTQLLVGNAVNTISGFFAVIFFIGLYNFLRSERPEPTEMWPLVGLVGAISLGVFITVGQASFTMGILHGDDIPGVTQVFNQFADIIFTITGVFVGVTLLGFGLATMRSAQLPNWLGQLALVGALVGTVASLSAGAATDNFGYVGFLAFLLTLIWVLATSVLLMRSAQPATATM